MSINFKELDDEGNEIPEKKPTLLKRFKLWWKHEGQYLHYEFKRGISNLIAWFPIVWKDRNWDYRYIYDLLQFKINRQADYIKKRNNHTQADYDASRMKTVTKLMKLVHEEYYNLEYYDYFDSDMWFEKLIEKEPRDLYELKTNNTSEKFQEYIDKYPHAYREVKLKYPILVEKEDICRQMGIYRQRKAKHLLFALLEHNIEHWWD